MENHSTGTSCGMFSCYHFLAETAYYNNIIAGNFRGRPIFKDFADARNQFADLSQLVAYPRILDPSKVSYSAVLHIMIIYMSTSLIGYSQSSFYSMCVGRCTFHMVLYTCTLQIEKNEVDNFEKGKRIPSCQLIAECETERPTTLKHLVTLNGAIAFYNTFTIYRPCDSGT
jgi:hypothetical protein